MMRGFPELRCWQDDLAKMEVAILPSSPSAIVWTKAAEHMIERDLIKRRDGLSPKLKAELDLERYLRQTGNWMEAEPW